jgi:hypothetical protein
VKALASSVMVRVAMKAMLCARVRMFALYEEGDWGAEREREGFVEQWV